MNNVADMCDHNFRLQYQYKQALHVREEFNRIMGITQEHESSLLRELDEHTQILAGIIEGLCAK